MVVPKKKPVAKKTVVKKTVAKKAVAKKSAATKKVVKKTPTKKVTVEQTPAKKLPPRKVAKPAPMKIEKPNISDKTLEKLKALLLQERAKNLFQSQELAQEAIDLITDREAGDTQFDEESGEGDSIAVDRERSLFLSSEAQKTVDQIDRALERMEDKTYGVCPKCGKRIGIPRLEALPWAEVCIECKSRTERRF